MEAPQINQLNSMVLISLFLMFIEKNGSLRLSSPYINILRSRQIQKLIYKMFFKFYKNIYINNYNKT